ncbi:MAG: Ornithine aminotransferase [Candidatus Sulfotelmatobacter sp.]|nr:Ornithine aminotransferase [Candidatus Sulfotelmatobacter sp.]
MKLASERIDSDIAMAALRAMEWDAFVPSDKVQVAVSNAWVTLKARSNGSIRSRMPNELCAGC